MKRKIDKATLITEAMQSLKSRYGFTPARKNIVLLEAGGAVIRFEVAGHTYSTDREFGRVGEMR